MKRWDYNNMFEIGANLFKKSTKESISRTLRKAREQVKIMVEDGNSTQQIRKYLRLWSMWWVQTSEIWNYQTLLTWFLRACWENNPAKHYATGLLHLMKKDMQITHERVLLPQQALNHQAQTV